MKAAFRPDIISDAVAASLRRRGWETIEDSDPGRLIATGAAEVAIGPAIGYGRHLGPVDYGLIPGFGVMLDGPSGMVRLAFPPGRSELTRIAVRSLLEMETIVAGLVLIEKYDIEPEFVEVAAEIGLDDIPSDTDGMILWGEESIRSELLGESALDIGDEWVDMTGEPLPWLLAWGRSDTVREGAIDDLNESLGDFALEIPTHAAPPESRDLYERLHQKILSGAIEIGLDKDNAAGQLAPFFHFAFYHGIISDIPTIKHLPIDPVEGAQPDFG
jgi:predicted solute-binding protein